MPGRHTCTGPKSCDVKDKCRRGLYPAPCSDSANFGPLTTCSQDVKIELMSCFGGHASSVRHSIAVHLAPAIPPSPDMRLGARGAGRA